MALFFSTARGRRRDQRGVTLIELMIVIAIIGILAALAVPSFSEMIGAQRIKGMSADLHVSLMRARSEAIKRNRDVTIAPVTANSWTSGWTIADPDNVGNFIENHGAVLSVTATGPANIVYQSSGRINAAAAPEFNISATGTVTKRCVSIDLSGRPYVKPAVC